MLYRNITHARAALVDRIFNPFCKAVGHGEGHFLCELLFGRYVYESPMFGDDTNYWAVHEYFEKNVLPHKIHVFNAGMELAKNDWFLQFIGESMESWVDNLWLHDLSKFSANESFGYAFYKFGQENPGSTQRVFDAAWLHHKNHNEHHPEYWIDRNREGRASLLPMPKIYIAEMVADWIGAGRTYGSTIEEWLPKNLHLFIFHKQTKDDLTMFLEGIGFEIKEYLDGIQVSGIKSKKA